MPSPHWRRNSDSTGFSSVSVASPMCTGDGDTIPYVAKKSQRFLHVEFFLVASVWSLGVYKLI